jgi:chromate transport protein ChrA
LLIFAAVTVYRHVDIARWASTRVAKQVAKIMGAVLILFLLAVLSARVRQNQWVKAWFCVLAAVAVILWHFILCVSEVTVGTRPVIER